MASSRTHIFISYARSDARDLALRLYEDFQTAGHPVWLDLSEIPGGSSWSEQIESAIEGCDLMVVLMSPASFNSQWCRAEQLRAIRKGKRLIPLLVIPGTEIPLHLEHLNYLNFTIADAYAERFRDLLSDIRAGEAFQLRSAAAETKAPEKGKRSRLPKYKVLKAGAGRNPGNEKRSAPSFRRYLQELRAADWLGARFWWPYFLFTFTDAHSLINILKAGALDPSFNRLEDFDPRRDKAADKAIDNMVRLYFRPRTPDLFNSEGFRAGTKFHKGYTPIPVYLLFDMEEIICQPDTTFKYGDPAEMLNSYSAPKQFRELPFENIYHDTWVMPEERDRVLRFRKAQVMIPERLGLESLQFIWMRSAAEYETLHHLMPPELWRTWRDKITTRTDYHLFNHRRVYVQSAALMTKQVHFHFNLPLTEKDGGSFQAEAQVTYPDGSVFRWRDESFQPERDLTLELPNSQPGYTVRFTLDGDLAYAGTHLPEQAVL